MASITEKLLMPLAPKSQFDAPSPLYNFLRSPVTFVAHGLQTTSSRLRPLPPARGPLVTVVVLSDTHDNEIPSVPAGDLLIHCGDMTNAGTVRDIQKQIDWLASLPHRHKVAIAGNHDTYLDPKSRETLTKFQQAEKLDWKDVHYLQHQAIALDFPDRGNRTLRLWGAPQIPACGGDEFAFQFTRGHDTFTGTVPIDTDVLVTHTPPKWHLDLPVGLGCEWLAREDWRVQPQIHCFGHVHAGSGSEVVWWDDGQKAYERICERRNGLLKGLLDFRNALDLFVIVANFFWALLCVLVLGSRPGMRSTVFVNAACMRQETGRPENRPKVLRI